MIRREDQDWCYYIGPLMSVCLMCASVFEQRYTILARCLVCELREAVGLPIPEATRPVEEAS